jgi:anti-sigma B factor antagonist
MQTELRHRVDTLLDRGERWLVLDLRTLSGIDAAGVGELVRAFNRTRAAGGMLQVANTGRRVQTLLDVTGVSTLLTAYRETAHNHHSREAERPRPVAGGC